jgi:hypothetical protein
MVFSFRLNGVRSSADRRFRKLSLLTVSSVVGVKKCWNREAADVLATVPDRDRGDRTLLVETGDSVVELLVGDGESRGEEIE